MSWLKLTAKALYLMDSSSDSYLKKVDLKEHNPAEQEFKLSIPLEWFQGVNAPGKMSVELNQSRPEPIPVTPPPDNVLDIFKKVIKAKDWSAISARPFPLTNPKYIVIHHTDSQNPPNNPSRGTPSGAKAYAQSIQRDHKSRTPPFKDSGHNFLNTTAGLMLEGRHGSLEAIIKGRCVSSAHALQDPGKLGGGNESPGIENEGNFMTHKMGKDQWDSLVALCAGICKSCDIDPSQIRGHRDFSNTDCPGDWLYSQLPKLRNEVRAKL